MKDWTLQQFHHTEIIDESLLEEESYSDLQLFAISKKLGEHTYLRGMGGSDLERGAEMGVMRGMGDMFYWR